MRDLDDLRSAVKDVPRVEMRGKESAAYCDCWEGRDIYEVRF